MNSIIIDGMSFTLPLFIIAVGGIYSERSGVTNLALEGFLGAGGFFGALFVAFTSSWFAASSQAPMYFAIAISMLGGALYAMLHAVLCIHFKANQVISGVVVNIIAMALTDFLTSQINAQVCVFRPFRALREQPRDNTCFEQHPCLGRIFHRCLPV